MTTFALRKWSKNACSNAYQAVLSHVICKLGKGLRVQLLLSLTALFLTPGLRERGSA